MAQDWNDLGNGQWKLTITDDDGMVPPVHVKGTKDEILFKLANSKIHGDRRINELRGTAVNMSASERMQTVAELQDPAKVDQAVTRIVERAMGAPMAEVQQDRAEEREERQTRMAVEAATTFATTTPGWFPSEFNNRTLTEYMKRMGLNPLAIDDYRKAFTELQAAKLLQAPPAANEGDEEGEGTTSMQGTEVEAERTAPTPANPPTPKRFSTGIRSSDISGQPTKPVTRLKYSREQIERMGAAMYKELMSDPEFVRCVEYYGAQKQQRRAS